MPVLPSGRRVELSTDRFMAHLANLSLEAATRLYHSLQDPDDLLHVADVVYFAADGQSPHFADFVAADWEAHAQDWEAGDKNAFRDWLFSAESRQGRQKTIAALKETMEKMEFPN